MKRLLCAVLALGVVSGAEVTTEADEADVEVGETVQAITTDYLLQSRSLAYDAYQAAYGMQPSDDCKTYVRHLTRTYLPQAELREACGTTLNIGGCSFYTSQRVYIEDVLINSRSTHAHEFEHVVLGCMRGSTDSGHTGPAWAFLAVLTFGM